MEPVLLDFIQTNINSFIKWDLLMFFSADRDTMHAADNIAKYAGRTMIVVEEELEDWIESGLIVKRRLNGVSTYALVSDETSRAALVSNFISACEDREIRIKVVYHIVQRGWAEDYRGFQPPATPAHPLAL